MSAIDECYAGDTWPLGGFKRGVIDPETGELLDLAGFTCFLAVKGSDAVAREVTDTTDSGKRFLFWLTPEETRLLGARPAPWTIAVELRNAGLTPPLVAEEHLRLRIRPEAVPAG